MDRRSSVSLHGLLAFRQNRGQLCIRIMRPPSSGKNNPTSGRQNILGACVQNFSMTHNFMNFWYVIFLWILHDWNAHICSSFPLPILVYNGQLWTKRTSSIKWQLPTYYLWSIGWAKIQSACYYASSTREHVRPKSGTDPVEKQAVLKRSVAAKKVAERVGRHN